MDPSYFICSYQNCNNAIASNTLNSVQLRMLNRWPTTCLKCGNKTHWLEQKALLEININLQPNGGAKDENNDKAIKEARNKKLRQKRAHNRGVGLH